MILDVLVQVAAPQEDELVELLETVVDPSTDLHSSHRFDGESIVQAMIGLSLAGYPYFKTWLTTRASQGKGTTVSFRGMNLRGYTAEEVAFLCKTLANELE